MTPHLSQRLAQALTAAALRVDQAESSLICELLRRELLQRDDASERQQ